MKILPSEKLTLITEFSKTEVIEKLKSSSIPKQSFNNRNKIILTDKKFEGSINDDCFNVTRIINYRNSFLPVINGKINDKLNGAEIEIELKPASFVKGLMTLWFGGVSFAFITTLFGAILGETPIHVVIFPLFMLLMGFGILKFGFSTESENSKKDLMEVLQAKIKKK